MPLTIVTPMALPPAETINSPAITAGGRVGECAGELDPPCLHACDGPDFVRHFGEVLVENDADIVCLLVGQANDVERETNIHPLLFAEVVAEGRVLEERDKKGDGFESIRGNETMKETLVVALSKRPQLALFFRSVSEKIFSGIMSAWDLRTSALMRSNDGKADDSVHD